MCSPGLRGGGLLWLWWPSVRCLPLPLELFGTPRGLGFGLHNARGIAKPLRLLAEGDALLVERPRLRT